MIESGDEAIEYVVRDLSSTGALLEVSTPLFIPDRITLVVPTDGLQLPLKFQAVRHKSRFKNTHRMPSKPE
jgi:hypothetical protein